MDAQCVTALVDNLGAHADLAQDHIAFSKVLLAELKQSQTMSVRGRIEGLRSLVDLTSRAARLYRESSGLRGDEPAQPEDAGIIYQVVFERSEPKNVSPPAAEQPAAILT